jgi:hypothetical protein
MTGKVLLRNGQMQMFGKISAASSFLFALIMGVGLDELGPKIDVIC